MSSLTSVERSHKAILHGNRYSQKAYNASQPRRTPSLEPQQQTERTLTQKTQKIGGRKEQLRADQHSARKAASTYTPQQPLSLPSGTTKKEDGNQKNPSDTQTPNERLQRFRQQDRIAQLAEAKSQQENGSNQAQQNIQQEKQQIAQDIVIDTLNGILTSTNIGTGGIASFITGIPHFGLLAYQNIRLFWGTYAMKGKSRFFPPIKSHTPLLPDQIFHMRILVIDLLLLIFLAIGCFLFIAIIYAATKVEAGFFSAVYNYFTDPFFQQVVDFMFEKYF